LQISLKGVKLLTEKLVDKYARKGVA